MRFDASSTFWRKGVGKGLGGEGLRGVLSSRARFLSTGLPDAECAHFETMCMLCNIQFSSMLPCHEARARYEGSGGSIGMWEGRKGGLATQEKATQDTGRGQVVWRDAARQKGRGRRPGESPWCDFSPRCFVLSATGPQKAGGEGIKT